MEEMVTIKLTVDEAEKLLDILLDARDQGVPVKLRRSAKLQELTDTIEAAIALRALED